MDKKNIYLDISASTPMDKDVAEQMHQANKLLFGNPSSIHSFGQSARAQIEVARKKIAKAMGCSSGEIIFTSGGSESNNHALGSILSAGDHVITSSYEHPSVLEALETVRGIEVSYISPDTDGTIKPDSIDSYIRSNTKLISIMWANNEMGTVNDIQAMSDIAAARNILFHSDAVQAFGKIPIDLERTRIDFMSVTAHKIYGPKGIGALFIRSGNKIDPLIYGGGQEQGLRAGTENTSSIVGFGAAAEIACTDIDSHTSYVNQLEEKLIRGLEKSSIEFSVNGTTRLPGVFNVCFNNIKGSELLMNLDIEGVAISYGSACSSGSLKPSETLTKCGIDPSIAESSVRISFGRLNTADDIDILINKVIEYSEKNKVLSGG